MSRARHRRKTLYWRVFHGRVTLAMNEEGSCDMSENITEEPTNKGSKSSVPSQQQPEVEVHIFVGGLRRPAKKQNDDAAPAPEKPSERADG